MCGDCMRLVFQKDNMDFEVTHATECISKAMLPYLHMDMKSGQL